MKVGDREAVRESVCVSGPPPLQRLRTTPCLMRAPCMIRRYLAGRPGWSRVTGKPASHTFLWGRGPRGCPVPKRSRCNAKPFLLFSLLLLLLLLVKPWSLCLCYSSIDRTWRISWSTRLPTTTGAGAGLVGRSGPFKLVVSTSQDQADCTCH